jgi:hypothetical protein
MGCSKQSKAAGAGTALVVVGAVLLSASVGTIQVASANVESGQGASCNVGQLGVFQSTYSPECAKLPGTSFKSNTLDYWPLFPAQTSFASPLFVSSLGVGASPFTTCDEYIPEAAQNASTVPVATFSSALQGVAPGLLAAWSQQAAPAVLSALLMGRWFVPVGLTYNDTYFQASPFDAIAAAASNFTAYSNFTGMVRLVQQSCQGASSVVTAADCAGLMAASYALTLETPARVFEAPVGAVFADYTAYTLSALQLTQSMSSMAAQAGQAEAAAQLRALALAVNPVYEISLGCSGAAQTVTQCAALSGVPLQGSEGNYPLAPLTNRNAAGAASRGSYFDFTKGVVAMLAAGTVPEQFLPVFEGISGLAEASNSCIGLQQLASSYGGNNYTTPHCLGTVVSYGFFAGLYSGLEYDIVKAFSSPVDALGLLAENVTAQCALNDVDQAKFATSQKLIISALFFLWLAALTGAGATALGSLALNAASTVGSLVGAITLVVGLFNMYTAPVYAKVGAHCEQGAVCYTSSVSIPLAIAAIAFSAASIIAFSVATVFARKAGKASQDNAMANKGAAGEAPHTAV